MADVQELMNKMESLNKELTTIIDETKQGLTAGEAEEAFAPYLGGSGSGSNCPRFTRKVKLCCTTVVKHFDVSLTNAEGMPRTVKLIFDPSCLHAVVECETVNICNTNCGNIRVYVVKVVGCIPFAFSVQNALDGDGICGNLPASATIKRADLCCQGCICVDNNICCYTDKHQAECVRQDLAGYLNCDGISFADGGNPSAELLECKTLWHTSCSICTPDNCKDETYVKFEAKLEVPSMVAFTCQEQENPPSCTPCAAAPAQPVIVAK